MQPHPQIHGVAKSVPAHRLKQADVKAWARRQFEKTSPKSPARAERLLEAFDNAGIETRYSCVPLDWYDTQPGWHEKNKLYLQHASALAADAAAKCLRNAGKSADEIDCLVSVSTSGIATPSLDARLVTELRFRADVLRLPVFGLGCAGGVMGLARAADMARAEPGRLVLLIVVELCGLTFRSSDRSKSNVIATALFGDGAAAVLLSVPVDSSEAKLPALHSWGEHTWPDSLSVMGWSVEDDGLGVLFSRDIPKIVANQFNDALSAFLDRQGLGIDDFDGYICHPGGAKVVSALEGVFALAEGGLERTRNCLRDYGNMSAASALFVLDDSLANAPGGRYLMTALGPGFSAAFCIVDIP